MKKYLLASSALVLATFAVNAQAIDAEFYGQVNKGLVWADDSVNSEIRVSDNDVLSTRFGFRGEQEVRPGLSASFLIEGELQDGDSTDSITVAGGDAASAAASNFVERHARVGLTGNWSSATDGITEIDLSGVENLTSDVERIGGAILFNDDAGAAIGDTTVASQWANLEGFDENSDAADRVNLVRYDSPIFNGFQVSAAAANGGDWDLAARYGNKFGAYEVKAGLGYVNENVTAAAATNDDITRWSGSVAVKHDSGWNGALAYGKQDQDSAAADDIKMWYAKVGYDTGAWGFAADYGTTEAATVNNQELNALGLGAQYNWGKGVSSAVTYRNFDLDRVAAGGSQDVDLLMVSTRVKF